jgi:hypothetical protein
LILSAHSHQKCYKTKYNYRAATNEPIVLAILLKTNKTTNGNSRNAANTHNNSFKHILGISNNKTQTTFNVITTSHTISPPPAPAPSVAYNGASMFNHPHRLYKARTTVQTYTVPKIHLF